MHWFMAILGAILGLVLGGGGAVFLGLVVGSVLGAQWSHLSALRQRLDEVEKELRTARARAVRPELSVPEMASRTASPPQSEGSQKDSTTPAQPSSQGASGPDLVAPGRPIAPVAQPGTGAPMHPAPATSPQVARAVQHHPPAQQSTAPSTLERALGRAREGLFGGNLPVKIGVLVLLFGVAAALKYSVDAGWLRAPITLRLAMIAAGGVAALVWGWRSRRLRPAFGLSLQGGGVGVLLLTIFAAYRLYHVLPSGIAFALVLVLVVAAAALAVLQDAVALAVLGFLGGYLAPVLLSTGTGSHVTLFSFYALLNLAVFAIAWIRHWRILNLLGFGFTFIVGLAWGAQYYRPEFFATVEPFLILFVLFYIGIVVLHALRAPVARPKGVDGTLLFGTPLLAFSMQAAMLYQQPMALAWSALALALVYALLTVWLLRRGGQVLLGQSFGILAVAFATLAVPLAFSSRSTSVTWALEAAALVWLGQRQRRGVPQLAGVVLYVLAAIAYAHSILDGAGWRAAAGEWPLLNGHALTVLVLSATAFAISWLFERAGGTRSRVWPGFVIGLMWWALMGAREIHQHLAPLLLDQTTFFSVAGWVGFAALSLLLFGALRRLLHWPRFGWGVLLVLACSVLLAPQSQTLAWSGLHWPLSAFWLAWVVAALFALSMLREPLQRGTGLAHVLALATVSLVYGLALARVAEAAELGADWQFMAALLPLGVLVLLTRRWPAAGTFPLAREFPAYARLWFIPASVALILAWVESLSLSGDSAPLRYMPLLNPADLPQLVGLLVAAHCFNLRQHPALPALFAAAGFAWLSMAALRAVHQYTGLPWSPLMLESGLVQATLTVVWSIVGVSAWIVGSRRRLWSLWLVGAIVLAVVLVKLALMDRQYVGNLTGIVSFIAVGLLLVAVGRIAPTPPRHPGPEPESTP